MGEIRYLWERGIRDAGRCGCGATLMVCGFWSAVLDLARTNERDVATALAAEEELLRVRHLPRLLAARGRPTALGTGAAAYARQLGRLYRAVHEQADGAIIVDSSKLVSYGYLLSRVEGLDVRVLHLVRDPRGAAYSWTRARSLRSAESGGHRIQNEGPAKSAALWDLWNVLAELLWAGTPDGYVRLRYEDVTTDPVRELAPVLRMLAVAGARVPVLADRRVELPVSHTVAGNPNRMAHGPTAFETDLDWIAHLGRQERVSVTGITGPLLHHFGYAI